MTISMKKTMNNISIYTIEGCSICDGFKSKLKNYDIVYDEVICASYNKDCDNLENVSGCETYPMCVKSLINNHKIILCLASDYNQTGTPKQIDSQTTILFLHSIDNMISVIEKL